MATFTELTGLQSGIPAIAKSGDTIDFTGITLTNFTVDGLDDGTATMSLDGSGNLVETGMVAATLTPSAAITLTAGAASTWSTSAGALTLTSAAAATWSTAAGALTLDGASGLLLVGNSSEIDITTTGALDLNSGAGTWDASTLSIDSTDTTNLTMTASDAGAKTLSVIAANGGAGTGNLSLAADDEVDITGTDIDINGTGLISVDAGGAVSIDAGANSNFTVAGADLVLSTTTSGEVDITSAGLVDINAGANLDIDVTGSYDMLATGAFSVDGTGASNVSATSGDLTLSTVTSGDLLLTGAGAVDITMGAASDISLPDNTSGALVIGEGANPYLTFQTTDNQELIIAGKHILLSANDGSTAVIQNGFVAGETITAANVVALDYDTDGARVFTCQADDATAVRKNAYGVAISGGTAAAGIPVATQGVVLVVCTDAVLDTGADIGAFCYVDDGAKAGQVTTTPPSTGRVSKVGIIVAGNGNTADTAIKVALQPQFLYDN